MEHPEGGELAEAWRCLKGWYAAAGDRPPKPCHKTMAKQTAERVDLYERVPPPGEPIRINVEPNEVEDACPGDVELRIMVWGLANGRAGGTSGIRAETIKGWLRGVEREEKEEEGNAGAGDAWRTFLKLIERLWETGCIPQQILLMAIVLLPKGGVTTGEFICWTQFGRSWRSSWTIV